MDDILGLLVCCCCSFVVDDDDDEDVAVVVSFLMVVIVGMACFDGFGFGVDDISGLGSGAAAALDAKSDDRGEGEEVVG